MPICCELDRELVSAGLHSTLEFRVVLPRRSTIYALVHLRRLHGAEAVVRGRNGEGTVPYDWSGCFDQVAPAARCRHSDFLCIEERLALRPGDLRLKCAKPCVDTCFNKVRNTGIARSSSSSQGHHTDRNADAASRAASLEGPGGYESRTIADAKSDDDLSQVGIAHHEIVRYL